MLLRSCAYFTDYGCGVCTFFFFFFKQKTAYEMRISDWSSDVCSSDLFLARVVLAAEAVGQVAIEALGVAGGVVQFVQAGPVIIDLLEEGRLRRHSHEIE